METRKRPILTTAAVAPASVRSRGARPHRRRRFAGSVAFLALTIGGAAACVPAAYAGRTPAEPAASSLAKLSARLVRVAGAGHDPGTQSRAAQLPLSGPGSLLRRSDGSVLTYVRVRDTSTSTIAALDAAGARVVHVSPDYDVVTAAVPAEGLERVARMDRVIGVSEALAPRTVPPSTPSSAATVRRTTAAGGDACGSATSEGDAILQSAATRKAFGVDGTGTTVGILSDSFDGIGFAQPTTEAQDVATGDLPGPGNPCGYTTPVRKLHDSPYGFDEGRAMAQIVHDLAPGAKLMFVTDQDGQYAAADYIKEMYRAGATVITDDVEYLEEPFYQRSVIGEAIGWVTARGVVYTSAAGNSNAQVHGKDVSSYDTPRFRPTGCPRGIPDRRHRVCHSFDPKKGDSSLSYRVGGEANMYINLHSAQPENGVTTDFDAYLIDHHTHQVLASDTDNSLTSGATGLRLFWNRNSGKPSTVDLVLVRRRGTGTPAWRAVFIQLSGARKVERVFRPDTIGRFEIFGHNGDPDALTTAAANWADSSRPETYSSRGPVRWDFGPAAKTGVAGRLRKPRTIAKPDLAATDDVLTTFFLDLSGGPGPYRFAGTSAAAPHAAGVAALLKQIDPSASPAEIKHALTTSASTMRYGSARSTGNGRVDAYQAALLLRPHAAAHHGAGKTGT